MPNAAKTMLKQYSAYDLIEKAIEAVEKDVTTPGKFKTYFRVDFTFPQLCAYLKRKKIWGKPAITEYEYSILTGNKDKGNLLSILKDVKNRNTKTIYDDFNV